MHVVVIGGPIASGKSMLGRAVAARFRETEGVEGAVIDLDLVYEMLDPRGRPKADPTTWSAARRVAGRFAAAFLAEGRSVVVEGAFAGEGALSEFVTELPSDALPRLVLLEVDFAKAFERASADPSRGVSKDRAFLSRHYSEFASAWGGQDVLRLDTGAATVDETADSVVNWLGRVF